MAEGSGHQVVADQDPIQSAQRRGLAVDGIAQAEGVAVIALAGRT